MSALPPKADMLIVGINVYYVPEADFRRSQSWRRPNKDRGQPSTQACGFCSCSMIWSTLKLDGFCRGGNSLKVATNSPTNACIGTTM